MGFRFRKSIKIIPGVRLNLGKSGSSLSFGGKGFTVNVNKKGTRTTVGLLGTGLSHSTYQPHGNITPSSGKARNNIAGWLVIGFIVLAVIIAVS